MLNPHPGEYPWLKHPLENSSVLPVPLHTHLLTSRIHTNGCTLTYGHTLTNTVCYTLKNTVRHTHSCRKCTPVQALANTLTHTHIHICIDGHPFTYRHTHKYSSDLHTHIGNVLKYRHDSQIFLYTLRHTYTDGHTLT